MADMQSNKDPDVPPDSYGNINMESNLMTIFPELAVLNKKAGKKRFSHDIYFYGLFCVLRFAKAFMAKVIPSETQKLLDIEQLTIAPRVFLSDRYRWKIADMVFQIPSKNTDTYINIFVVVEHKSYGDRFAIIQLGKYVFQIIEQCYEQARDNHELSVSWEIPSVLPILFRHQGDKSTKGSEGPCELRELYNHVPGLVEYQPNVKALSFNLDEMSVEELPEDEQVPELKVGLILFKYITDKKIGLIAHKALQTLIPYWEDLNIQKFVQFSLLYLFYNAGELKYEEARAIDKIFDNVNKRSKVMTSLADRFLAEGEAKGEAIGIAKGEAIGIAKGETIGIAKGETIGIAKGEVKGKIEFLLTNLKIRFGELPEEIVESIRSYTDSIALQSLFEYSLRCQSLEEFKKELY